MRPNIRFEIPGIPCDEWNSTFRFVVGITRPRPSGSKFRAIIRNQKEDSFTFVYSLLGLFDDSEVKINDVSGEGEMI